MSFQIDFQKRGTYKSLKTGITIDAVLRYGNREQLCSAKVDTGSEVCLFTRILADALEIEVESGYQENFSTLGSGITGYAHEIELETLGLRFHSYVYFAESYSVHRNLLGRQGWLQLVTLGLDDYNSTLYLNPNNQ